MLDRSAQYVALGGGKGVGYIDLLLLHMPMHIGVVFGVNEGVASTECLRKGLDARGCRRDTWLGISELV